MSVLEYLTPLTRSLNSIPHDLQEIYIFDIHHIIALTVIYPIELISAIMSFKCDISIVMYL
jgi:hypothetical protein